MIVDSPLITNLALGVDRRIPQDGDAQLVLPPTLNAVTEFLQPTLIDVSVAVLQFGSFVETNTFVRTNAAALISTLALLSKGLWRITYNCYWWWNYTGAVAGADFSAVRLKNTATGILSEIAFSYPLIDTAQNQIVQHQYLLNDNATIELSMPLNGVGETLIVRIGLNCEKVL